MSVTHTDPWLPTFLPRCMQCRRALAMRILSVRPSVRCLSNAWIVTKWKKNQSRFFIPYERSFSLVSWEKEWWMGATPSTWNLGSTGPRGSEIADYETIMTRSASAVTPTEKSSININRKSYTRFPISIRWSSYVAPEPQRGSKTKKLPFFD